MSQFIYYLIPVFMLLVVGVLLTGLFGFTKGGEFNKKYANKLMRWRIILQFVAVILAIIFVMLVGK